MRSVLLVAVLISALALIYARQLSRDRFGELQDLQQERDELQLQWRRLLLEQGAWSAYRRTEEVARRRLKMRVPGPDAVVVIGAEAGP